MKKITLLSLTVCIIIAMVFMFSACSQNSEVEDDVVEEEIHEDIEDEENSDSESVGDKEQSNEEDRPRTALGMFLMSYEDVETYLGYNYEHAEYNGFKGIIIEDKNLFLGDWPSRNNDIVQLVTTWGDYPIDFGVYAGLTQNEIHAAIEDDINRVKAIEDSEEIIKHLGYDKMEYSMPNPNVELIKYGDYAMLIRYDQVDDTLISTEISIFYHYVDEIYEPLIEIYSAD